ncbi:MAG TPA: fibronectin type III domain-containing protein [Clostridia bacterium]|nr:fibronectin type III domain-containing protein [Clostridia bacterium]
MKITKLCIASAIILSVIQIFFQTGMAYEGSCTTIGINTAAAVTKDVLPPATPAGITATNKTCTSISLYWVKSTDNVGVKGYILFRDGKKIITLTKTSFINTQLVPGRKYTYSLKAYDAAGNISESSAPIEVMTVPDIQQPSTPGALSITATDYTTVTLSWGSSSDNTGIKGYQIYRNGRKAASTSGTSYVVKGLLPGTIYSFSIKAYDAAGNYSQQSNTISGATVQDKLSPSVPAGLKALKVTETEVTLTWELSSDNVKVKRYEVFCTGGKTGTISRPNYSVKKLIPGKSYVFTVKAIDSSGNASAASTPFKITTLKDNIKPSAPAGLKTVSIRGKSVKLEWKTSTDNTKVKGYRILCNGIEIANTTKTSRTVKSPMNLGIDVYYVQAYDLAGNYSDSSNKITVITP